MGSARVESRESREHATWLSFIKRFKPIAHQPAELQLQASTPVVPDIDKSKQPI
jgi:hypothetical protein